MKDPDIMWFCVPCRKEMERSIEIDKQIEEKCNAIKEMYENKLTELEARIDTKVNEADVRKIAKEVFKEDQCKPRSETNYTISGRPITQRTPGRTPGLSCSSPTKQETRGRNY